MKYKYYYKLYHNETTKKSVWSRFHQENNKFRLVNLYDLKHIYNFRKLFELLNSIKPFYLHIFKI